MDVNKFNLPFNQLYRQIMTLLSQPIMTVTKIYSEPKPRWVPNDILI